MKLQNNFTKNIPIWNIEPIERNTYDNYIYLKNKNEYDYSINKIRDELQNISNTINKLNKEADEIYKNRNKKNNLNIYQNDSKYTKNIRYKPNLEYNKYINTNNCIYNQSISNIDTKGTRYHSIGETQNNSASSLKL